MAAGGEADDADAMGIDGPLGGIRSHQAHGALDIEKFRGVVIAVRPEAVFEKTRGDSKTIEPAADGDAFAGAEMRVSTAGTDDDGGAGEFRRGGKIEGERGNVVV